MSSKQLKVGVIGVGGIAGTHMSGWAESEHAIVVAGADLDAEVLGKWSAKHELESPKLYTDTADLFADPDIDIVDICAPSNYHADLAVAALDAGKHVICEKPLASTPEGIERMIAARDKSGKLLMTAQHMRFVGKHIAVKKEIESGRLGDIYYTRAWWLRRSTLPARPGFIYKKNSGGGPCIDIGVHQLDLALWLIGNPKPVSVTGVADKYVAGMPGSFSDWGGDVAPDMDVEDFASGFVRFEDGTSLQLEVSWLMHHPKEETALWIYGNQAGVEVHNGMIYESDNEKRQRYDVKLTVMPQPHPPHATECMAFAKAVAEGGESPVPAEQSLAVQRILNGLYESAETGNEVRLDG
jgi:predicted dehydrogenase